MWTVWKAMPSPEKCREIEGPQGPGVYQVKNNKAGKFILFGIGKQCRKRMKSLFPAPYGTGKRNNAEKREYIFKNWKHLSYRTFATDTREIAKSIEDKIKSKGNHKYNT